MALADELLNLRRELAAASSPLQRMQMLARSWRRLRQLSPAQRKQLAKAVGAEGAESVLDRIAARKGRVGASFLVPSLEKFKGTDPEVLSRLIAALRDPERRREVLQKSASAVGDVLNEEPVEEPEVVPEVADEPEPEVDGHDEPTPAPPPPVAPPPLAVAPSTPASEAPVNSPGIEDVRDEASLVRRLAMARELLENAQGWSVDQLGILLDAFPQDWARRRILSAMLVGGLPGDTAQAIDLIGSLNSRASRRWCVSLLLHERQLSEVERQALGDLV